MPKRNSRTDRPRLYAISRIDLPDASTHGWQVRLQRRGVMYRKFFADGSYGNDQMALTEALRWRDTLLETLSTQSPVRTCESSRRNSSGVIGVSKVTVVGSNGTVYEFWQATWSPSKGQRCCIKFSIKRHGDRTAFKLAVEARTDGVNAETLKSIINLTFFSFWYFALRH